MRASGPWGRQSHGTGCSVSSASMGASFACLLSDWAARLALLLALLLPMAPSGPRGARAIAPRLRFDNGNAPLAIYAPLERQGAGECEPQCGNAALRACVRG
jgi:hypothetical protein